MRRNKRIENIENGLEQEVNELGKVIERLRRAEADINVIKKILHTMLGNKGK